MKLENLKKIEAFKKSELSNALSIIGGIMEPVATSINGKADSRDYETDNGNTDGDGTPWDFYYPKE